MRPIVTTSALLAVLVAATCCASEPDSDGAANDAKTAAAKPVFTHKMMKRTGENPFASLAYECPPCTFEQWQAIEPPTGWTKGPAQALVASSGEMRSRPSLDGVPDAMDFIESVPGPEYKLIAKNLDGKLVASSPDGFVVEAKVMRDNWLRYDAGRRVHELTAPDGGVFVLFAYEVDPTNVVLPKVEDATFMADFKPPTGWTYASRILDKALLLDSPDVATVLAVRLKTTSTWQKR